MSNPNASLHARSPLAFEVHPPEPGRSLPLVFDSPHSSTYIPPDMDTIASRQSLLTSWDAYVDEIWRPATRVGGTLLTAQFHRAYVDANRDSLDIDQDMLSSLWPITLRPSKLTERGMGLVRRYALPGEPMYHRKLRVDEVRKRIALYYEPYHDALRVLLDTAADQFGAVWHINCHSMKSTGNAMNVDKGTARPDIVVSDNDGRTADPGFTWFVADCWRSMGYTVSINAPYKGGEIVKRYGRPQANRHSIQIEINRRLYMNEATFVQTEGFHALQAHTKDFLRMLRDHVIACSEKGARHRRG